MKCKECDREAKWLVIDQMPYDELFLPLCEEHFQELKGMEGELNLEFDFIELLTLDEVVSKANEKWKHMNQKYKNLLEEYSTLKEKAKNAGSTISP